MALHHTQIKKLAAAEISHAIEAGVLILSFDGIVIAQGPEANAKALVAEAINVTEDEDALDALREKSEQEDMDQAEDEDAETQGALAKTIAKYRNRYKDIGANDSNGDALALALRAHTFRAGEKSRDGHSDVDALRDVLDQNGLSVPANGRNNGHTRMIYGNVLRGFWNRGNAVHVGSVVVEPTAEGLARKAAAHAKDEAKANRQPRTKQTEDERKAKAKAARAKRKADKASAHEPEQAETAQAA